MENERWLKKVRLAQEALGDALEAQERGDAFLALVYSRLGATYAVEAISGPSKEDLMLEDIMRVVEKEKEIGDETNRF